MRCPGAAVLISLSLAGCSNAPPPPTPPVLEGREGQQPLVLRTIDAALADVRNHPQDADRWRDLGLVYHANRLIDLAAPCYQYALTLEPDAPATTFYLAMVLWELGDTTTAVASYDTVSHSASLPAGVASTYGRWLLRSGDPDRAATAFQRDLAIESTATAPIVGLARYAIATGDDATAVSALEPLLAVSSTPNRPWIAHLLAGCFRRLGRDADAVAVRPPDTNPAASWTNAWTDALWRHRKDAEWLIQRAHEQILARDPAAALGILAPLKEFYPTDPAYLKMMGMAHYSAGDLDLAISYMEEVVSRSPDDSAAAMNLGFAYAKAGDLRQAQQATRRAIDIDPANSAAVEQLTHIENAMRNNGQSP